VRSALEGLGYQSEEIRAAIAELPDTDEVESLLRHALQALGRQS
jgi:Holliday junction resolvasome RuvABC DNA-binding subunit